jgi:hypothetical protein
LPFLVCGLENVTNQLLIISQFAVWEIYCRTRITQLTRLKQRYLGELPSPWSRVSLRPTPPRRQIHLEELHQLRCPKAPWCTISRQAQSHQLPSFTLEKTRSKVRSLESNALELRGEVLMRGYTDEELIKYGLEEDVWYRPLLGVSGFNG